MMQKKEGGVFGAIYLTMQNTLGSGTQVGRLSLG